MTKCAMEQFFRIWVEQMLQPLLTEVQPHKITAFDWTPAHWGQVARQSEAGAYARYAVIQSEKAEQLRLVSEKIDLAKRLDNMDIGVFEL